MGESEGRFLLWVNLVRFQWEFDEENYRCFHRDQKRQEFMKLIQFCRSMIKYEINLKDLANFILKLVGTE